METNLNKIKRVTLTTQVRQNGKGYPDTIADMGSLLVVGFKKYIMFWKIIGKPKQMRRLTEGVNFVLCIVVSKKTSWFAAGNKNGIIKCWNAQLKSEIYHAKYEASKLLYKDQFLQKRRYELTKLLLNKNEDELISGYNDGTIKVWKVNCHINTMQYEYDLEKQHTQPIYFMSLNEKKSELVSFSKDKTIIIWYKNEKRWKCLKNIQTILELQNLCFITNSLFAYEPYDNTESEIFDIKNGYFVNRPDFKFQIKKDLSGPEAWFPILYNQQQKVIIQIHNGKMYFFKKYDDGFKLIFGSISCPHKDDFCGHITSNGEILIVWNDNSRLFRIYKIQ